jgi:tRNA(adenine34) deaminase
MSPWTRRIGMLNDDHSRFMALALEEAQRGAEAGEQPFGAVVVREGTVVAKARSLKVTSFDATAHAETLAIGRATRELRVRSLTGCTFYATCEPCPMCAGAIINTEVSTLVIGARFERMRNFSPVFSVYHEYSVEKFAILTGSHLEVISGVLTAECEALYRRARITVNG